MTKLKKNILRCPYCNEEMLHGYIQMRDEAYWCENIRLVAALPPIKGRSARLNDENRGPFRCFSVEAFNCPKCKKVIISYGE